MLLLTPTLQDRLSGSSCMKRPRIERNVIDTIGVRFSDRDDDNDKVEVVKKYAVTVCAYIAAQLEFNERADIDEDIKIFGLSESVAGALLDYLQFDSRRLMRLPKADLKHLANYYELVEIREELERQEIQEEALNRKRVCAYCKSTFVEAENDTRSCPRRTLDAQSRLCVRCGCAASFCSCAHVPSKHTERV